MACEKTSRYEANETFSFDPDLKTNWEVDRKSRHPQLIMLDKNKSKHIRRINL